FQTEICMAMPDSFQLGLLPERKMDWSTLASSYGFVILLLFIVINIGLLWPDRLQLSQKYHVTELIPMPGLQPKALKLKTPRAVLHAKLLPPVLFAEPRLTVPRDIQRAKQQAPEMAPPKVAMNNFTPAVLKVAGGAR